MRTASSLATFFFVACPAPAPAPNEPPAATYPEPTGTLVYAVGDGPKGTATRALPLPAGQPSRLVLPHGFAFPGPADPMGTHAVIVALDVDPASQASTERLLLAPLDATSVAEPLALAGGAALVRSPVWSPDGAFLVFESSANSFRDLYRVARSGGEVTRLTDAPHGSFEPAISPDGLTLAFGSSRDGNAEVYTQPLAGGLARRLTDNVADDRAPDWRPDGARLAWLATRDGHARVWTMAPDGTDAAPLREGTTEDLHFAWSPDGRFLAVATQTAPDDVDLVVYDAVRGLQIGAFTGPDITEQPAWSPDSRWLAFFATHDGNADLYIAHPDGTEVRRLTSDPKPEWLPRWVP
ncbi:hypothetical protein LBMAG42_13640 [Deltaproteobacteria bacterium]|nr:hypothetical protein LBMAG42_13640 [Deltaproteobacteria bacterium]